MKSLCKNGIWELVPPPVGKKIVGSKLVFKNKKKEGANPGGTCYKACLITKGTVR